MRLRVLLLAAAVALVATSMAGAMTVPKLFGTVGPGFTISLKNATGKAVKQVKAGKYTFVIHDKSHPDDEPSFCWRLLEHIQQRPAVVDLDAGSQVERDAEVSFVEPAFALPLADRVHREAARALEPPRVAGAAKELEEREAVS